MVTLRADHGAFEPVDDLVRALRFSAIDEKLRFLPYTMVRELREMLDNGRLSLVERDTFLRALDGKGLKTKPNLTKDQRRKVRQQIDAWVAADEAIGAALRRHPRVR